MPILTLMFQQIKDFELIQKHKQRSKIGYYKSNPVVETPTNCTGKYRLQARRQPKRAKYNKIRSFNKY